MPDISTAGYKHLPKLVDTDSHRRDPRVYRVGPPHDVVTVELRKDLKNLIKPHFQLTFEHALIFLKKLVHF